MSDLNCTYSYEGGEIFAIHEGAVIASGTDLADVESAATEYLEAKKQEFQVTEKENKRRKATHVITPNGVKGEVLGRTPNLWGEQVTVRFENGRIATFQTHAEDGLDWVQENQKTASSGIVASLKSKLDNEYGRDKDGLCYRSVELASVIDQATARLANGAPYLEEIKLDEIVTAARYERQEVDEALEYLKEADAIAPPTPGYQAVEQVSLGRGADDNWLDVTVQEMLDESEGQDFEQIMREGPALFVTELDTPALADAGTTREMALSHINEKTAGYVGDEVEDYRLAWIARTEVARRHELAARTANVQKEAAQVEASVEDAPDEALFM